jgi:hypothetical protein
VPSRNSGRHTISSDPVASCQASDVPGPASIATRSVTGDVTSCAIANPNGDRDCDGVTGHRGNDPPPGKPSEVEVDFPPGYLAYLSSKGVVVLEPTHPPSPRGRGRAG